MSHRKVAQRLGDVFVAHEWPSEGLRGRLARDVVVGGSEATRHHYQVTRARQRPERGLDLRQVVRHRACLQDAKAGFGQRAGDLGAQFLVLFPVLGFFTGLSYYSSLYYGLNLRSGEGRKSSVHEAILARGIAVEGRLPCRITFFLEGEEESGSPSLVPFLKANADEVRADMPVRGIATSGWRGRSLSLGIADSVTVLAATAAEADAAATMIANAVDVADAMRPVLLSSTDLAEGYAWSGLAPALAVAGDRAYVAANDAVAVLDIADAQAPRTVGEIRMPGEPHADEPFDLVQFFADL